MSLLLRKACQPELDARGLSKFHVEIYMQRSRWSRPPTRFMQVVGECGKPLFTVNGVSFSRINPIKSEIEFAQELLRDFVDTNYANIMRLLKLIAQNKAPEPKMDPIEIPEAIQDFNPQVTQLHTRYDEHFDVVTPSVGITEASCRIGDWIYKFDKTFKLIDIRLSLRTSKKNKTIYTEVTDKLKVISNWEYPTDELNQVVLHAKATSKKVVAHNKKYIAWRKGFIEMQKVKESIQSCEI